MRTYVYTVLAFLICCSMGSGCASRKSSEYLNVEAPTREEQSDIESQLEQLRAERELEQRRIDRAQKKEAKARLKEEKALQKELERNRKKAAKEAADPDAGKPWWLFGGSDSEGEGGQDEENLDAPASVAPSYRYRLKPGDQVVVQLLGIPNPSPIEDIVDENGNIKMDFIDTVPAAGKTSAELEAYIKKAYLDGKIYKNVSVSVMLPMKSYFIRGEVLKPGRFPLLSGVTLLQSIAAAGGFNEYANPKKITIIRGGKTIQVSAYEIERDASQDLTIEEGDVIVVRRSIL